MPNLVLSGHVHDYQRIEQTIAPHGPTPFIVCGNGGYHNLHQVHSKPGTKATDTKAELKYAAVQWGFMTLTIDKDHISGVTMEIDRAGDAPKKGDSFSYSAKPIKLADPKSVPDALNDTRFTSSPSLAGAFGAGTGTVFLAGFSASASAAVLRSSISLRTRAAMLPRVAFEIAGGRADIDARIIIVRRDADRHVFAESHDRRARDRLDPPDPARRLRRAIDDDQPFAFGDELQGDVVGALYGQFELDRFRYRDRRRAAVRPNRARHRPPDWHRRRCASAPKPRSAADRSGRW